MVLDLYFLKLLFQNRVNYFGYILIITCTNKSIAWFLDKFTICIANDNDLNNEPQVANVYKMEQQPLAEIEIFNRWF